MAFPNPPTNGQVYDHPNGLEYVYNAATKTWDLVYATGTNTGSLPLINPTSFTLPTSLPEVPPGTIVQADYNQWLFDALQHVNTEANIEVEPAPGPTDPDEGRLWYNSDTDKLYLYYNDGTSSQWIEIVGGGDVDLDGYATEAYVDDAIAAIPLSDYATITYSDEEDTKLQEQIDDGVQVQTDIQTEQGVQNNQINALETQIQLLAQTQAAGKWKYVRDIASGPRPPADGTFYGTHTADVTTVLTDWSDLRLIMVDNTDLDGNNYTFSAFEEGDKIEILATDGSSACFGTVTNNPTLESYGNMIVTVERSNGGPSEDKEYILSVYRPGANGGDVDLDVLDGRYLIKTGGTMTGNLYIDTGSGLYSKEIIKSTRDTGYAFQVKPEDTGDATAYIHTNGNAEFSHVKVRDTPTNNSDLTTKEYVDSQIGAIPEVDLSGHLPLTGGTVTGNLTVQGVSQFATAKSSNTPTNSSDLTTKAYVDQAVAQANLLGPARLAWKRSSNTSSDADPGDGYFKIHLAGGGATYYRLSLKTANGVDFGYRSPDDSGSKSTDYGPIGTIWLYYPDTNQWRLKQEFRVNSWRWNYNNHIEFKRSSKFGVSDIDFTTNSTYYITVGGFF